MQLGEMLLESGLVSQNQLDHALKYQKDIGGHLGHIICKVANISEQQIMDVLSRQLDIKTESLESFEPDRELMNVFPREVLEKHEAVPLRKEMGTLILGVTNPTDFAAQDELRLHAGGSVEFRLIAHSDASSLLTWYFHDEDTRALRAVAVAAEESDESSTHRRRFGLSDLVEELGREAAAKKLVEMPAAEEIDETHVIAEVEGTREKPLSVEALPTRLILVNLITLLVKKKLVSEEEMVEALIREPEYPQPLSSPADSGRGDRPEDSTLESE